MAPKDICPFDCPNRCAAPNCHDEDTCERWKKHMEEVRKVRERVEKGRKEADDVRLVRAAKQRRTIKEWEKKRDGR